MLMLLLEAEHFEQFRTFTDGDLAENPQHDPHQLRRKFRDRRRFWECLLTARNTGMASFSLDWEDEPEQSCYLSELDITARVGGLKPGLRERAERALEALRSCERGETIPVPWRAWRWLIHHGTRGTFSMMLGTCCRALFTYKGDHVKVEGRVSGTWVSRAFGVGLAAVKRARSRLMDLGWISRRVEPWETPNHVKRLGMLVSINPAWTDPDTRTPATTRPDTVGRVTTNHEQVTPAKNDTSDCPKTIPRSAKNDTSSYLNSVPVYPSTHHPADAGASGASRGIERRKDKEGRKGKEPDIRNVVLADLEDEDRVHELYDQAVELGWLKDGEWERAETVRLARHCREAKGIEDPVRAFAGMLRAGDFSTIANRDEVDPGVRARGKKDRAARAWEANRDTNERRNEIRRALEPFRRPKSHAQRLAGAMA